MASASSRTSAVAPCVRRASMSRRVAPVSGSVVFSAAAMRIGRSAVVASAASASSAFRSSTTAPTDVSPRRWMPAMASA